MRSLCVVAEPKHYPNAEIAIIMRIVATGVLMYYEIIFKEHWSKYVAGTALRSDLGPQAALWVLWTVVVAAVGALALA